MTVIDFRQLLLDLRPEQTPTLDNFVPGPDNLELLARLRALATPQCFDAIYLWGPAGCGRSHLLEATARLAVERRPCVQLRGGEIGVDIEVMPGALLVVDDIDELGAEAQIALFRTFNSARLAGLALLLAGPVPPLQLALREDLRTRVGQTLVYEVKPLSDDEKAAALHRHALQRGMKVDDALVRYLLRHSRRDLPSLMAVLNALDRVSLEQQRPLTLPLLREVLQTSLFGDDDNGPGSL